MTTVKDLTADVRRMAYGTLNDQINIVKEPYTAGSTTLHLDLDITGITPGMTLSSGLNVWYVRSTDPADSIINVIPGFDNSPTASCGVNDFVYIKPRVTDWYLFGVINDEIVKLSSPSNGLYRIDSWTMDVDPTWQVYDIPVADMSTFIGLLRVRYRFPGSDDTWIDIPDKGYRIQVNDGTSRIRLLRSVPSGTEIQFLYKASFTKATSLSSNLETDCGLTDSMVDIPPLGAYSTLMRTTESRRSQVQQQGDARRAQEVSSGANASVMQMIDRDYRDRVAQEYIRLVQRVSIQRSL
jgi:hypothetical protein